MHFLYLVLSPSYIFYAISEGLGANLTKLALNKDLHACTIHDSYWLMSQCPPLSTLLHRSMLKRVSIRASVVQLTSSDTYVDFQLITCCPCYSLHCVFTLTNTHSLLVHSKLSCPLGPDIWKVMGEPRWEASVSSAWYV